MYIKNSHKFLNMKIDRGFYIKIVKCFFLVWQ